MFFSWCCCRDSAAPGNETKVHSAKAPVGITDADLREEELGGSELQTPRDSAAQKVILLRDNFIISL